MSDCSCNKKIAVVDTIVLTLISISGAMDHKTYGSDHTTDWIIFQIRKKKNCFSIITKSLL